MKERTRLILKWLKVIGLLVFMIVLVALFEGYGIVGFFLFIIGIAIMRLITRWQHVMVAMRYIETMIFGKPLDKEMWDKGEFKNRPKVKWVWRKKENENND